MCLFLIPLALGFALTGASAFTAAYSRRWGEWGGRMATSILRNLLGIPLSFIGFILAWLAPAPFLFNPGRMIPVIGWFLIVVGSIPVIWGHLVLGWRTHMPSVRDTLVRHGLYAYVRHPIYAGGLLIMVGLVLLRPTSAFALACVLWLAFFIVQARLEEIDLVQRLPAYREYMEQVPRFIPRSWSGHILFYLAFLLLIFSLPILRHGLAPTSGNMFLFVIPLMLGFAFVGISAFTAAYSRWWGEQRGELATSILRNYLGIPLGVWGFLLAWFQPAPLLFTDGWAVKSIGGLLLIAGSVPFIWGHIVLGQPTGWPSVRDTLVRHSLYAYVRHPIYAGGLLICIGGALLKPTSTVVVACALGFVWLIVQARLEEIDLLQRLPSYRGYMKEAPRFVPRLRRRGP
ncbi:MAG: isoprenylcysteine carboxylmethyltransferase family protein [Nitrospirae bacterium]|nr:isoprenylcysteine carboxylmethyltransferase family protein [Nitrospirota bacterium]